MREQEVRPITRQANSQHGYSVSKLVNVSHQRVDNVMKTMGIPWMGSLARKGSLDCSLYKILFRKPKFSRRMKWILKEHDANLWNISWPQK